MIVAEHVARQGSETMPTKGALPQQRQEEVFRILAQQGFASVTELAEAIGVSEMTVRRYLDAMEEEGRVQRVFGGARVKEQSGSEVLYTDRLERDRGAKEAMARCAASMVEDGDSVALDGSTTVAYLARRLRERSITAVTNSLLTAKELAGGTARVIVLGGVYRHVTRSLVGPQTERDARSFHVDRVFFSCRGLDAAAEVTDSHLEEVAVKQALISGGGQTTVVADQSKFERVALHTVATFKDVQFLVTDAVPPKRLSDALRRGGTEVKVAANE